MSDQKTSSKQAKAKQEQGYTAEGPKCGNCKHRQFDMVLPAWMVEHNRVHAELDSGIKQYGDQYKQPKNQRCGIGGFAIKVQGWCVKHEAQA